MSDADTGVMPENRPSCKRLKVYGTIIPHRMSQFRCVVAATSQKRAAELIGCTINHLRTFGSVTGNHQEIKLATGKPGTVFWADVRKMGLPVYSERPMT